MWTQILFILYISFTHTEWWCMRAIEIGSFESSICFCFCASWLDSVAPVFLLTISIFIFILTLNTLCSRDLFESKREKVQLVNIKCLMSNLYKCKFRTAVIKMIWIQLTWNSSFPYTWRTNWICRISSNLNSCFAATVFQMIKNDVNLFVPFHELNYVWQF